MMKRISILLTLGLVVCVMVMAQNPITKGLPEYGLRDCHVLFQKGKYWMVGTEVSAPESEKRGIALFSSSNMKEWKEVSIMIDRKDIHPESKYKDGWDSPELHLIDNEYILCFGGRNDAVNPYSPTEVFIAKSKNIEGPYQVINEKPIVKGNRFSLLNDDLGKVYGYWELDGTLYAAEVNSNFTGLVSDKVAIVSPQQLHRDDKFMDSPNVIKIDNQYYLFYCVFKGGYYAAYAVSSSPFGPWERSEQNQLFYRSEDQAPTELLGRYQNKLVFAPPCEIIGHVYPFKDKLGKWRMAYHSEDKYAEPFLCIDSMLFENRHFLITPTLP